MLPTTSCADAPDMPEHWEIPYDISGMWNEGNPYHAAVNSQDVLVFQHD
jgi:hypothetical protein